MLGWAIVIVTTLSFMKIGWNLGKAIGGYLRGR